MSKNSDIIRLIRPDLRQFLPYRSARDEAKAGTIWLNANESPYMLSSNEETAINRYPDKQPVTLQQKLASLYQVEPDQIVVSRGSDEIIDLLVRLFCVAGEDSIMITSPTYGMYAVSARLQGAGIIDVPLLKERSYQMNLSSMISTWNKNVKIIFICSPNNPTGNLLNREDILLLCEELRETIVVVDEAYIDFAETESLSSYINQYPNLIILRTLSKAYGLAGARIGCLLAQQEIAAWVLKILAPYPLPSTIDQIVNHALSEERIRQVQIEIRKTNIEKKVLLEALQSLPFIKQVMPSDANFLCVEMQDPQAILNACAEKGIILRGLLEKKGLEACIRISIGTSAENKALLNVLKGVKIR